MLKITRLLAIDDDSGRYDGLRRLLEGLNVELTIVTCAKCIRENLLNAHAIFLDFDLDSGALCQNCFEWPEQVKSLAYVNLVAAQNVPVIISSGSYHENRKTLLSELKKLNVKVTIISALEIDPELKWIGWLWCAGVLRGEKND